MFVFVCSFVLVRPADVRYVPRVLPTGRALLLRLFFHEQESKFVGAVFTLVRDSRGKCRSLCYEYLPYFIADSFCVKDARYLKGGTRVRAVSRRSLF